MGDENVKPEIKKMDWEMVGGKNTGDGDGEGGGEGGR